MSANRQLGQKLHLVQSERGGTEQFPKQWLMPSSVAIFYMMKGPKSPSKCVDVLNVHIKIGFLSIVDSDAVLFI